MATDAYHDILKQARETLTAEEQRRLAAELQAQPSQTTATEQRQALLQLLAELESFPVTNPSDGMSNRDHDRLLYD